MSYKEIGKVLNISESNVAVRIHRAKKILADQLRKGDYI
jgi:DNA-directed RNA polymerase specialized sigma24 family protein